MKFKFKGYELDDEVKYLDDDCEVVMIRQSNEGLKCTIISQGHNFDLEKDLSYLNTLRPITIHDPIKKEPEYEIGKYYLFSDNNSNWVTSMLKDIDDGRECRYCTGSLHYRFIKPIPLDMIGKVL